VFKISPPLPKLPTVKISRRRENQALLTLAIASLIGFADLNSEHPSARVLGLTSTLVGAIAAAAWVSRCDRIPSKVEERLGKQKQRLDEARKALNQSQRSHHEKVQSDQERISQERLALEQRKQDLTERLEAEWARKEASMLQSLERARQSLESEYSRKSEQLQQQAQKLVGEANKEAEYWKKQAIRFKTDLSDLTAIKVAPTDSPEGWIAYQCQRIFQQFGLPCSCEKQPLEAGDRYLVWLQPRGGDPVVSKLKELEQELPLRVPEIKGNPNVYIDAKTSQIKLEIPKQAPQKKEKQLPPLYNWNDLEDEASGIIIAGNTGAVKSGVALWCAGKLTERSPKQVIALDVHAKKNYWHTQKIPTIHKQSKVIRALEILLDELNRRKETGEEQPELVVIIDEISALRANCTDKDEEKWVLKALLLLGAEGRKFGLFAIIINQSKNVEALGIDGQNRNNYALLLLCAAARDYRRQAGWGDEDLRTQYLEEKAYSCLMSGSIQNQVAKHPTHGEYRKFVKKGLPPKQMLSVNQLPLTIKGLVGLMEQRGNRGGLSGGAGENPPISPQSIDLKKEAGKRLESLYNGESTRHPLEERSPESSPRDRDFFPCPPSLTPEVIERVLDCKRRGLNQQKTIKELWGLSKNTKLRKDGTPSYWMLAREIYNQVVSED